MRKTLLAALSCIAASQLAAQWLRQPTVGIPRNTDGRPNLSAPAPRAPDGHPDLSGLWRKSAKYALDITVDAESGIARPWAQALAAQRADELGRNHMSVLCLPAGPAYPTIPDFGKVIQTPSLIAILHPDLTYRQIFMDGRALEADPNPTWMGYSVGRWEGDTLVVESFGFNDRTWLDATGHPHTEALRTTERYTRLDLGRMELVFTLEDPEAYTKPWTVKVEMTLVVDTEMIEYVCNENEKDRVHMVGTVSEDRMQAVALPSEVLARYEGRYQMGAQVARIAMERDQLILNFSGLALPLIPYSEAVFSSPWLGRLEFAIDAEGAVTGFTMQTVGAEMRAVRAE